MTTTCCCCGNDLRTVNGRTGRTTADGRRWCVGCYGFNFPIEARTARRTKAARIAEELRIDEEAYRIETEPRNEEK